MYSIGNSIRMSFAMLVIWIVVPTVSFSGGPAPTITTIETSLSFKFPFGIAVDHNGHIIISHDGRMISRIGKNGQMHPVAGGVVKDFEGDGKPASQALLFGPGRFTFDQQGNLFVPDMGNHRIRKIDYPSGVITTVVGHGPTGRGKGSFAGDGGPGSEAFLNRPISVVFDSTGALYIADAANFRVRKVTPGEDGIITGAPDEIIETIAGIGKRGFSNDKKLAVSARIAAIDLAIDRADQLFLADGGNNRIRRVDKDTGIITTVIGSGPFGEVAGYSGNGSDAKHARMSSSEGIVFDSAGNLYIADVLNHRVRMVTPGRDGLITGETDEIITTIVGSGTIGIAVGGFQGDGGPALESKLNQPQDMVIDAEGNLVVVDGLNHRLRRVILHPKVMMPIHAPYERAVDFPQQNM